MEARQKAIKGPMGWVEIKDENDLPNKDCWCYVCILGEPQQKKYWFNNHLKGFRVSKYTKEITHYRVYET